MGKILVTGGAGFIGSNLCEHLVKKGYDVVCLDDFSTGHLSNIKHLLDAHPQHFSLIVGDIRNLEICKKAVDGVCCVLHEAALGSVPRSVDNPILTNDVNVNGFLNMLIAARDCHVKRFIFASSSSVYGNSITLPKREDDRICSLLSPYAITKYVNELYADVFARLYGLEYIGLRYFNVFGRRQDPNSKYSAVIPLFIKQLVNHESPNIFGDGSNSRDFTYIENVIHMNMLAIEVSNSKAVNQIYNTACGEKVDINLLANSLKYLLAKYDSSIAKIKPKYCSPRLGDISCSYASVEKARNILGYNSPCSFKDGLEATVKWFWEFYSHHF